MALNADVRRTKARLLDEAVKLQKIAAKKVKAPSLFTINHRMIFSANYSCQKEISQIVNRISDA